MKGAFLVAADGIIWLVREIWKAALFALVIFVGLLAYGYGRKFFG